MPEGDPMLFGAFPAISLPSLRFLLGVVTKVYDNTRFFGAASLEKKFLP
jgi:hypothetical protein